MLNIVIFGAPGSGKGTQSDNIIKEYNLFHISTGDVLRDNIKRGTELGATAKAYMDKGQLIPDELMISILADEETIDEEAEALEAMLQERGTSISAVVGLEVPEQELVERILLRGKMTGRSDDNPETVKNRLAVYHNQTSPLQAFYQQKGLYHAIKGTGKIEDIFADIKQAIDSVK